MVASAMLAGVMVFTAAPRAQAMDPVTQGLLSQLLSGFVLGTPYGAPGTLPSGGYGAAPYDPYGTSPYGSYYPPPQYGSYGAPPPSNPYGVGGGYGHPFPGVYGSSPRPYRTYDYGKAMRRLDRQEADAMAKAYRRSYGNPARYNARTAKIEQKYAYKRYKVERNTGYRYGYR